MSGRLGMCDRLNSLVCNDRLNSQWRLRHPGDSALRSYWERVEYILAYKSKFCFI